MKKTTQLFLAITILFFTISCKKSNEKKSIQEQPQQIEAQHYNEVEELKLNDGNLWEANAETTDGIHTMLQLMNNFSEDETLKSYVTLKQSLVKEFKTIIQKCTMTDEAHDQLHIFIIPMRELFNGLTDPDLNIRKEKFNKLNAHLKTYKNYFK